MSNTNNTKIKKRLPLISWIGLGVLAVVLLFNGYTVAKYFARGDEESLYVADTFYFDSDLLQTMAVNGTYPTYTLRTGVDTISLDLSNYADSLRNSEVPITYNITVTGTTVSGAAYSRQVSSSSLDSSLGTADTAALDSIKFDSLEAGTYTVTVTTEPYTETLGANFILTSTDKNITYTVEDSVGSPVLQVVVQTNDYSGDILISWPQSVLPDNTDPLLAGATSGSYRVTLEANSEYTFLFFKTKCTVGGTEYTLATKYTVADITVTAVTTSD